MSANEKVFFLPILALAAALVAGTASLFWFDPGDARAVTLREPSSMYQNMSQYDDRDDPEHEAMHQACINGDTGAVQGHMDAAHPGGDMGSGMGNGHMTGGMMGSGTMGGGMMGGGMMGSGMMAPRMGM